MLRQLSMDSSISESVRTERVNQAKQRRQERNQQRERELDSHSQQRSGSADRDERDRSLTTLSQPAVRGVLATGGSFSIN